MTADAVRDAMAERAREWDFPGCSKHNLMADRHCGDCRLVYVGILKARVRALEADLAVARKDLADARKIIDIGIVNPVGDARDRYREARDFLSSPEDEHE